MPSWNVLWLMAGGQIFEKNGPRIQFAQTLLNGSISLTVRPLPLIEPCVDSGGTDLGYSFCILGGTTLGFLRAAMLTHKTYGKYGAVAGRHSRVIRDGKEQYQGGALAALSYLCFYDALPSPWSMREKHSILILIHAMWIGRWKLKNHEKPNGFSWESNTLY